MSIRRGGYQAGDVSPSMTTGAEQVLPQRPTVGRRGSPPARGSERAWRGRSRTCCWWPSRCSPSCGPGPVQATLWPLACAAAGASAVLLIPVALVLGGAQPRVARRGLDGVLGRRVAAAGHRAAGSGRGASLLAGCGIGFATWLVLVCRGGTVPPRAGRVGTARGVAALVGTAARGRRQHRAADAVDGLARRARARRHARGARMAGRARVDACAWRAGCAMDGQGGAGRCSDEDVGTASPGGTTSAAA